MDTSATGSRANRPRVNICLCDVRSAPPLDIGFPHMRMIWMSIGLLATACGIAGVVLPLVPTTPFLLLAAFAFARSSPRLHAWLTTHPHFGPLIEDWRVHGAISRRAKVAAVATMVAALAGTWAAGVRGGIVALQAAILTLVAIFILSRPSTPPTDEE